MLQASRHAEQPGDIERKKSHVKSNERAPERSLAPAFVQPETEGLREPIDDSREASEQHAADDHIVEMRDEEEALVELEIRRRHGEQHAGHAAEDEGDHKSERPQHRRCIANAAAIHREQPVEDLHARDDRDDARRDAEKCVHVGARAHREEVMQPHAVGDQTNAQGRDDHGAIAEQRLAGESREHLGEDAKSRQHENVSLWVPPGPDQIDEHRHVAAAVVGEEMETEITVEREHDQRRGQDRKGRHDQQVRGERGPAENRHAHVAHARRAHLENRRHEIDPGHERADAGDQQRPKIIVDADSWRIGKLGKRRIGKPPRLREFADDERDVDEQRAGRGEPEPDGVQRRKGHVAHAELQRDGEIHEADDDRHRREEDHDRAVGGKDLVVVMRRKIARRLISHGLLRPHHHRVDETTQQHDQPEQDIHDADALMVDARDPFAPKIRQVTLDDHPGEESDQGEADRRPRNQRNGLIPGNGVYRELAKHGHSIVRAAALIGLASLVSRRAAILSKRPRSIEP